MINEEKIISTLQFIAFVGNFFSQFSICNVKLFIISFHSVFELISFTYFGSIKNGSIIFLLLLFLFLWCEKHAKCYNYTFFCLNLIISTQEKIYFLLSDEITLNYIAKFCYMILSLYKLCNESIIFNKQNSLIMHFLVSLLI